MNPTGPGTGGGSSSPDSRRPATSPPSAGPSDDPICRRPPFADATSIRRHRAEVIALLDEIIGQQPLAEWAERFDDEGVWWAPAQTPAEVVEDPQLLANDGIVEIEGGGIGRPQRR